jgi:hypothetical protein
VKLQARASELLLLLPTGKALERIPTRKIAPIPAIRLHAVLGGSFDEDSI